jgi:SAM-dependent methyltransferase
MRTSDQVRQQVASAYTAAVTELRPTDAVAQTGGARFASYSAAEVAAVPDSAVAASFGCGNPLAFSEVRPGETLLDLGCGAGFDLLLAAERVGPAGRVIGVDMTEAMVTRARAHAAQSGYATIEVRQGLIESLPVESASVDWVISNCVVNLSPEKDRVFGELVRVLKPGGRISIDDIVVEHLPWIVRKSVALYAACVGGAISEAAYLHGLTQAGLTNVAVRDRLVYEPSQIVGIVADLLPRPLRNLRWRGKNLTQAALGWLVRRANPQVWSAKFIGQKPAATAIAS